MTTNHQNLSEITLPQSPDWGFFGEVSYAPGGSIPTRTQETIQLVAIYEGHCTISINGQDHRLDADHICLLRPHQTESFAFSQNTPTHHSWVYLGYDDMPSDIVERLAPLPFAVTLTDTIRKGIDFGIAARLASVATRHPMTTHLATSVFYAFAHEAQRIQKSGTPAPTAVLRARRFIESRFADPLTLDDIAGAAHLSPNHLIRLFNRHVGTTPTRYLWQTRVRRGVDLLRATGLSVSEIAYRVGFQNPFHFSRLVKQHYDKTPSQLRNH